MIVYIIPITALLLAFMSLLASLRFIFSRQGLYWVFPAMISLILFFQNLQQLLLAGEEEMAGIDLSFPSLSPLILAALWYMMIIVFHYALKKTITENRFENDSIKNRAEAEYLRPSPLVVDDEPRRANLLRPSIVIPGAPGGQVRRGASPPTRSL